MKSALGFGLGEYSKSTNCEQMNFHGSGLLFDINHANGKRSIVFFCIFSKYYWRNQDGFLICSIHQGNFYLQRDRLAAYKHSPCLWTHFIRFFFMYLKLWMMLKVLTRYVMICRMEFLYRVVHYVCFLTHSLHLVWVRDEWQNFSAKLFNKWCVANC